jgi:hypothetical protein
MQYCLAEIILKLGLNTISTGGHIMKGKVFQNIMIDVRVRYLALISYSFSSKFYRLVISNYSIALLILLK